ncbi:hypothetical protein [Chelativorans sp. M5D2P16]|uniref:hypothetical protein n=1 Tax=Chelativorans sp. M5D2P16 TaxID=3095678 RepID=UPI002ACAD669|nr:hypothetical protein [Chelativorans sp. M5D2P16]MDZ5699120.1 hypothetical protein [Chelativorans sp. M5D2P16]
MVEKPIYAPLSGDLLPRKYRGAEGAVRETPRPSEDAETIDADYMALSGVPERAPSAGRFFPAPTPAPPGLEMLRGVARPAAPGRRGPWALAAAALLAAFWFSGGHTLLERTGRPMAEGTALGIVNLKSRIEPAAGGDLLIIEGEAVNDGRTPGPLPDLAINILGADGHITHYFLGTNGAALSAGERLAFSSRLAVPKDGVRSVSVTFRE